LALALEQSPTHLSCYILTYAPHTPLDEWRRKGQVRPLDEARVAALFEITVETLAGAGFVQYEISNFALAGCPPRWSRHNRKYWNGCVYLGLGPAAHSFDGACRSWNDANLEGYLGALKRGRRPPGGQEVLTVEERMSEALLLCLRQIEGIDIALFEARFAVDFESLFSRVLADLTEAKLATVESGRCRLTRRGLLVADAVAVRMAGCY
jgi:coproporphyrinogen III oxidase-like Fe-S oxidoreductase